MQPQHTTHEFSRPLEVASILDGGPATTITAAGSERELVARRLDLPAVHGLSATFSAVPWRGDGLRISGTINADIEQTCVVTLNPFHEARKLDFERCFVTAKDDNAAGGEVVVDPLSDDDEPDIIEGGTVDIGELVVEALALALDPYPRMPGVTFASPEADEEKARSSPFAVLAELKQSE